MYSIVNARDPSINFEQAVTYIHDKWGSPQNYQFYYDAMAHASFTGQGLPRFYLLLKQQTIVGCFALLTNDLVSRQDLCPWVACVFIEESERGQRLSNMMYQLAKAEARDAGFDTLYLSTDHKDLYEKFGWQYQGECHHPWGDQSRLYSLAVE